MRRQLVKASEVHSLLKNPQLTTIDAGGALAAAMFEAGVPEYTRSDSRPELAAKELCKCPKGIKHKLRFSICSNPSKGALIRLRVKA